MESDQIRGAWVATPVHYEGVNLWPAQQEGHAYGGLLIVPAYDEGGFWPDSWAIWHQTSGDSIIDEILAPWIRALEIATHLAELDDWTTADLGDSIVQMKLKAFAAGYPDVVRIIDQRLDGLDDIVPYRPTAP
jgi:hypothetical protein